MNIRRVFHVLIVISVLMIQLLSVSAAYAQGSDTAGEPRYAIQPQFKMEDFFSRNYESLFAFSDGLAFVDFNFIDRTGKVKFAYPGDHTLGYPSFKDGLLVFDSNNSEGVINSEGKIVVEAQRYDAITRLTTNYYHLKRFTSKRFLIVKKDKKYGLIDCTGKEIITPQYDEVYEMKDGLVKVVKSNKYGFLDATTGHEIIKPQYDSVEIYDYEITSKNYKIGFVKVKKNQKYGLLDLAGKEVVAPQYDIVRDFQEGLASVLKDERWGFIDLTGQEVIALQYDLVNDFQEGLAMVGKDGKMGFIDRTGKEIIKPQYDGVGSFRDGLAHIKKNWKIGLIDRTGQEIVKPQYDDIYDFNEGFAKVKKNEKYGYIDRTGKEIIKPQYDSVYNFKDGLALVEMKGERSFIDVTGNFIKVLQYDQVKYRSKYLLEVNKNNKIGFIDWEGKEVAKPQYDKYTILDDEGKLIVVSNGKYGLVDQSGKEIVTPQYDGMNYFSEDLVLVEKGTKFGLIDHSGKEVIKPQFDYLYRSSEGLAAVKLNGLWGFIYDPLDIPSDWAKPEVDTALSLSLIPNQMQYGYNSNITRADFTKLAVHLLEVKTGKPISTLLAEKNKPLVTNAFSDASDTDILTAYSLGIVGGKGEGTFDPEGDITRQEAAVMLARTTKILGISTDISNVIFADGDGIASWAKESVLFVSSIKDKTNQSPVMGSTGNNNFSPNASYTKQQAFITMKRLSNAL